MISFEPAVLNGGIFIEINLLWHGPSIRFHSNIIFCFKMSSPTVRTLNMYLWHSPLNRDGAQSDPSQSKSCQHALLEHINGTVYPWGNLTRHTQTHVYKNIIFHPLVQTFQQKKRCIRCQFQLQSLLCFYFLYLYDVPSRTKNTSAEADFLMDQNINLYTNKNSQNINQIFYIMSFVWKRMVSILRK